MKSQWIKVPVAILEKERTLGDQAEIKSLEGEDFLGRDSLNLVSRQPEVLTLPALVRHVASPMVGYVTGLRELVLTVGVRGISLKTIPVPVELGHLLLLQKGLYRVLPLEVHNQLVEAEAEVGAAPQLVRVQ